jgi:hypothetical protein
MSHNWDAARNETLDMLSQAEQAVIEMESARAELDRQKAARVELLKERREQLAVAQAGGNFPSEFRDHDERVVIAKLREMKQEQREQDEYVHSCQHYESLCKSQVRECTRDGRPEKAAIWEAAEKGIRRGEFITHPNILANPRVATQEFQSLRKLLAYNGNIRVHSRDHATVGAGAGTRTRKQIRAIHGSKTERIISENALKSWILRGLHPVFG